MIASQPGRILISSLVFMMFAAGCSDSKPPQKPVAAVKEMAAPVTTQVAPPPTTAAPASADEAIKAARTVVDEARANQWIWRDTEQLLKQAEKAAADGDEAGAIRLAVEAAGEARQAIAQHRTEQERDRGI